MKLLAEFGVALKHPYCSGTTGSKHSHMRELRVQHQGRPYRVLYAFDPRRVALLSIGGDKAGNDRRAPARNHRATKSSCRLRIEFTTRTLNNSERKGRIEMARKFEELEAKMSRESIARSDVRYVELRADMALEELRGALRLTQQQLAKTLNVDQSAISKLERRTDMYVSTLERFIEAMGGRLEIRAVFPAGAVRITQFEKIAG